MLRRLALVIALTVLVAGASVAVTALVNASLWWQAAIASGLVTFACSMIAIRLAYQILADPATTLRAWFVGMYVHFGSVDGGSLALILLFAFNPAVALLTSLAPAMVCVFGSAWIVQALTYSTGKETGTGQFGRGEFRPGGNGPDGHVAEAHS